MTTFTGSIPTIAPGDTTTVPTNLATYRDALKALSEAWTSYTPTWTGASGNPAIGDGTIVGAYTQVGKLVRFRITITMGSTTTYGSGQWLVSLPVSPKTGVRWAFEAEALETGVNQYSCRVVHDGTAVTTARVFRIGGGAAADSAVTGTAPFTWGDTDVLTVQGVYEAA